MKSILAALFLLFLSVAQSQTVVSMSHDGMLRTFIYYKPNTWDATQELPLLIVLHGLTQTATGIMEITDFNTIAEENNFIVCYPTGINNAWNANMNVSVSSTDDKGFIEKITAYFRSNFNTNPQKQYLCGFSNGGFMSHKMACESDDCFAAIATVSGNMSDTVYTNCNPKYLTSVLHMHGTTDAVVPYLGSITTGVSVSQTMEKWQQFLGCNSNPSSVDLPNPSLLDLSTVSRETYSNCTNSSLQLIKIANGGHQWPGISTFVGGVGNINMDIYSPQVIWEFLNGKSCPNADLNELNTNAIQVSPNPFQSEITISTNKEISSLELKNLNGKTLFSTTQQQKTISTDFLKPGVYFLHIKTSDNQFLIEKLIKN